MSFHSRVPAIPLIVNDPYFSIWMPGDKPTDAVAVHWTGAKKPVKGYITVDGCRYRFLGKDGTRPAETLEVEVSTSASRFEMAAGPVRLDVTFWSPTLTSDLDALSTPITFVDLSAWATDGEEHTVSVVMDVNSHICYDGESQPELYLDLFEKDGLACGLMGRKRQNVLCHSGDHLTIDWGYLWMMTRGQLTKSPTSLFGNWTITAAAEKQSIFFALGYDDIASVNYFGTPCRAWYQRNGRTLQEALLDFVERHDELWQAVCAQDAVIREDARKAGGKDYEAIVCAAWRHTFAAHKLVATPSGEMALLSKENDSNGCMGTVDVSYPSIPIFLKYCPELVNALCRPVLEYASMPVWKYDFAPHDVGRYPYATGQIYAYKEEIPVGQVVPPLYLYPAESDLYSHRGQMPVEESGNMITMLEAAITYGADDTLVRSYTSLLDQWVRYLDEFGDDPGEQLCTDDFAGHLAHNANLAAKAIVGVACYARILRRLNPADAAADKWEKRAHEMAENWLSRCNQHPSPLTLDGKGWSMKYNLSWDLVLGLHLMPEEFYEEEAKSYVPLANAYGMPLDSRADYTKSDWLVWCASLARDPEVRQQILAPLAAYLRETKTRVPFSDWYDTISGDYVEFIARSVQGGTFMPMLIETNN